MTPSYDSLQVFHNDKQDKCQVKPNKNSNDIDVIPQSMDKIDHAYFAYPAIPAPLVKTRFFLFDKFPSHKYKMKTILKINIIKWRKPWNASSLLV